MGLLIKNKKHFFTRLPALLLLIALIALGPILVSMIGAEWVTYQTGKPCHEGNCAWAVVFWYSFLTIPFAGLLLFLLLIVTTLDSIELSRKNKD